MGIRQPIQCAGTCGRMIRPYKSEAARWPGTLRWHASSMCKTCHGKANRSERPKFRDCEQCGHLTRPKGMPVADAPEGTRTRVGGLCAICYAACTLVTPERVQYITGEVIAYLRSRGRDIPAELSKAAS